MIKKNKKITYTVLSLGLATSVFLTSSSNQITRMINNSDLPENVTKNEHHDDAEILDLMNRYGMSGLNFLDDVNQQDFNEIFSWKVFTDEDTDPPTFEEVYKRFKLLKKIGTTYALNNKLIEWDGSGYEKNAITNKYTSETLLWNAVEDYKRKYDELISETSLSKFVQNMKSGQFYTDILKYMLTNDPENQTNIRSFFEWDPDKTTSSGYSKKVILAEGDYTDSPTAALWAKGLWTPSSENFGNFSNNSSNGTFPILNKLSPSGAIGINGSGYYVVNTEKMDNWDFIALMILLNKKSSESSSDIFSFLKNDWNSMSESDRATAKNNWWDNNKTKFFNVFSSANSSSSNLKNSIFKFLKQYTNSITAESDIEWTLTDTSNPDLLNSLNISSIFATEKPEFASLNQYYDNWYQSKYPGNYALEIFTHDIQKSFRTLYNKNIFFANSSNPKFFNLNGSLYHQMKLSPFIYHIVNNQNNPSISLKWYLGRNYKWQNKIQYENADNSPNYINWYKRVNSTTPLDNKLFGTTNDVMIYGYLVHLSKQNNIDLNNSYYDDFMKNIFRHVKTIVLFENLWVTWSNSGSKYKNNSAGSSSLKNQISLTERMHITRQFVFKTWTQIIDSFEKLFNNLVFDYSLNPTKESLKKLNNLFTFYYQYFNIDNKSVDWWMYSWSQRSPYISNYLKLNHPNMGSKNNSGFNQNTTDPASLTSHDKYQAAHDKAIATWRVKYNKNSSDNPNTTEEKNQVTFIRFEQFGDDIKNWVLKANAANDNQQLNNEAIYMGENSDPFLPNPDFNLGYVMNAAGFVAKNNFINTFALKTTDSSGNNVDNLTSANYQSYIDGFNENRVTSHLNYSSVKLPQAPNSNKSLMTSYDNYVTQYNKYLQQFKLKDISNNEINLSKINSLEGKMPFPSEPVYDENEYPNDIDKYIEIYKSYIEKVKAIVSNNRIMRNVALKKIVSIPLLTDSLINSWKIHYNNGDVQNAIANDALTTGKNFSDISKIETGNNGVYLKPTDPSIIWVNAADKSKGIAKIVAGVNPLRQSIADSTKMLTLRNSFIEQLEVAAKNDLASLKTATLTLYNKMKNKLTQEQQIKLLGYIELLNSKKLSLEKIDGYKVDKSTDLLKTPESNWDNVFLYTGISTSDKTKMDSSLTLKTNYNDSGEDSENPINNTYSTITALENIYSQIISAYELSKTSERKILNDTLAIVKSASYPTTTEENFNTSISTFENYVTTNDLKTKFPAQVEQAEYAIASAKLLYKYSKYISTRWTNWDNTKPTPSYSDFNNSLKNPIGSNYYLELIKKSLEISKSRVTSLILPKGVNNAEEAINISNASNIDSLKTWIDNKISISDQFTKQYRGNALQILSLLDDIKNSSAFGSNFDDASVSSKISYVNTYVTLANSLEILQENLINSEANRKTQLAIDNIYINPEKSTGYFNSDYTNLVTTNEQYLLFKKATDELNKMNPTVQNTRFKNIKVYYDVYVASLASAASILEIQAKMLAKSANEYNKNYWNDLNVQLFSWATNIDKGWNKELDNTAAKNKSLETFPEASGGFVKNTNDNLRAMLLRKIYYLQFLNHFLYAKNNIIPTLSYTDSKFTFTSNATNGIQTYQGSSPVGKISLLVRADLPEQQNTFINSLSRIYDVLKKPNQTASSSNPSKGIVEADYPTLSEINTFQINFDNMDGTTDDMTYIKTSESSRVNTQLREYIDSINSSVPTSAEELKLPAAKYLNNMFKYAQSLLKVDEASWERGTFNAAGDFVAGRDFSSDTSAVAKESRYNLNAYLQSDLTNAFRWLVNAYNLYSETKKLKDEFDSRKVTVGGQNIENYWKPRISEAAYDDYKLQSLNALNSIQDERENGTQPTNAGWTYSNSTVVPSTSINVLENIYKLSGQNDADTKAVEAYNNITQVTKNFTISHTRIVALSIEFDSIKKSITELQGQNQQIDNYATPKNSFANNEVDTNKVYGINPSTFVADNATQLNNANILEPSANQSSGLKNFNDNYRSVPTYSDSSRNVDYQTIFTSGKYINNFEEYIAKPASILPSPHLTSPLDMIELVEALEKRMSQQVYRAVSWANTDYLLLMSIVKFASANKTVNTTSKIKANDLQAAIQKTEEFFNTDFADANGKYYSADLDTAVQNNKIPLLGYTQKIAQFKANIEAIATFVYKFINSTSEQKNKYTTIGNLLNTLLTLKAAEDINGRRSYISSFNRYFVAKQELNGTPTLYSIATVNENAVDESIKGLLEIYKKVTNEFARTQDNAGKSESENKLIAYKNETDDPSKYNLGLEYTKTLDILKNITGLNSAVYNHTATNPQYNASAIYSYTQAELDAQKDKLQEVYSLFMQNQEVEVRRAENELNLKVDEFIQFLNSLQLNQIKDSYESFSQEYRKLKNSFLALEPYTDTESNLFSPRVKRRFDAFQSLIDTPISLLDKVVYVSHAENSANNLNRIIQDKAKLGISLEGNNSILDWILVLNKAKESLDEEVNKVDEYNAKKATLDTTEDVTWIAKYQSLVNAILSNDDSFVNKYNSQVDRINAAINKVNEFKTKIDAWNTANNNTNLQSDNGDGTITYFPNYDALHELIVAAYNSYNDLNRVTTSADESDEQRSIATIWTTSFSENIKSLNKYLLLLLSNLKIQNLMLFEASTSENEAVPAASTDDKTNIVKYKTQYDSWFGRWTALKPAEGSEDIKSTNATIILYDQIIKSISNTSIASKTKKTEITNLINGWNKFISDKQVELSRSNLLKISEANLAKINSTKNKALTVFDFYKTIDDYKMEQFTSNATFTKLNSSGNPETVTEYNPIVDHSKDLNVNISLKNAIQQWNWNNQKLTEEQQDNLYDGIIKILGLNGLYRLPDGSVTEESTKIWGAYSYALKHPTELNLKAISSWVTTGQTDPNTIAYQVESLINSSLSNSYASIFKLTSSLDSNPNNKIVKADDLVSYMLYRQIQSINAKGIIFAMQVKYLDLARQYIKNPTEEYKNALLAFGTLFTNPEGKLQKLMDNFATNSIASDSEAKFAKWYLKTYKFFIDKLVLIGDKLIAVDNETDTTAQNNLLNEISVLDRDATSTLESKLNDFASVESGTDTTTVEYLKKQLGFDTLKSNIYSLVLRKRFLTNINLVSALSQNDYLTQKAATDANNAVNFLKKALDKSEYSSDLKTMAKAVLAIKDFNIAADKYLNFDNLEANNISYAEFNNQSDNLDSYINNLNDIDLSKLNNLEINSLNSIKTTLTTSQNNKKIINALIEYSVTPNDYNRAVLSIILFETTKTSELAQKVYLTKTLIDQLNLYSDAENDLVTYWNKNNSKTNTVAHADKLKNYFKYILGQIENLQYSSTKYASENSTHPQQAGLLSTALKNNLFKFYEISNDFIEDFDTNHNDLVLSAEEKALLKSSPVTEEEIAAKKRAETKFIKYVYELENSSSKNLLSSNETVVYNKLNNKIAKDSQSRSSFLTNSLEKAEIITAPTYIQDMLIDWSNFDSQNNSNSASKSAQNNLITQSDAYTKIDKSKTSYTVLNELLTIINRMQASVDLLSESSTYAYLNNPANVSVSAIAYEGIVGIKQLYDRYAKTSSDSEYPGIYDVSNTRLKEFLDLIKERIQAFYELNQMTASLADSSFYAGTYKNNSEMGNLKNVYEIFKNKLAILTSAYQRNKTKTVNGLYLANTDFWRSFARALEFLNSSEEGDSSSSVFNALEKVVAYIQDTNEEVQDVRNDPLYTAANAAVAKLFNRTPNSITKNAYSVEGTLLTQQIARKSVIARFHSRLIEYNETMNLNSYLSFSGGYREGESGLIQQKIDSFLNDFVSGGRANDGRLWTGDIVIALGSNSFYVNTLKSATQDLAKLIQLKTEMDTIISEYIKNPSHANLQKILSTDASSVKSKIAAQKAKIETNYIEEYKNNRENPGINQFFLSVAQSIVDQSNILLKVKVVETLKKVFSSSDLLSLDLTNITLNIPGLTSNDEVINLFELIGLTENGIADSSASADSLYGLAMSAPESLDSATFAYISRDNPIIDDPNLRIIFQGFDFSYVEKLIKLQNQYKAYFADPSAFRENMNQTLESLKSDILHLNENHSILDSNGKWQNVVNSSGTSENFDMEKLIYNTYLTFKSMISYDIAANDYIENPSSDKFNAFEVEYNKLVAFRQSQNTANPEASALTEAEAKFHNLVIAYSEFNKKLDLYKKSGTTESVVALEDALNTFKSKLRESQADESTFSNSHRLMFAKIKNKFSLLQKQTVAIKAMDDLLNLQTDAYQGFDTVKRALEISFEELENNLGDKITNSPDSSDVLLLKALKIQKEIADQVIALNDYINNTTLSSSIRAEVTETKTNVQNNVDTTNTNKESNTLKTYENEIANRIKLLMQKALDKVSLAEAVSKLITELTESTDNKVNEEKTKNAGKINEKFDEVIDRSQELYAIKKEINKFNKSESGALTEEAIKAKITSLVSSTETTFNKINADDSTAIGIEKQVAKLLKAKVAAILKEFELSQKLDSLAALELTLKNALYQKAKLDSVEEDSSDQDTIITNTRSNLSTTMQSFDDIYSQTRTNTNNIREEANKLPFDLFVDLDFATILKRYKDMLANPQTRTLVEVVPYQKLVDDYVNNLNGVENHEEEITKLLEKLNELKNIDFFDFKNEAIENIATLVDMKTDLDQLEVYKTLFKTQEKSKLDDYNTKSSLNKNIESNNDKLGTYIDSAFATNTAKNVLLKEINAGNINILESSTSSSNILASAVKAIRGDKLTIGQRRIKALIAEFDKLQNAESKAIIAMAKYTLDPSSENLALAITAQQDFNTALENAKASDNIAKDLLDDFDNTNELLKQFTSEENGNSLKSLNDLMSKLNSVTVLTQEEINNLISRINNIEENDATSSLKNKLLEQVKKIEALNDSTKALNNLDTLRESQKELEKAENKLKEINSLIASLENNQPLSEADQRKLDELKSQKSAAENDLIAKNSAFNDAQNKYIADIKKTENDKKAANKKLLDNLKAKADQKVTAAENELSAAKAQNPVNEALVAKLEAALAKTKEHQNKVLADIAAENARAEAEAATIQKLESDINNGISIVEAATEYAKDQAKKLTAAELVANPNNPNNGVIEKSIELMDSAEKLRQAIREMEQNPSPENLEKLRQAQIKAKEANEAWNNLSDEQKNSVGSITKDITDKISEESDNNQDKAELINILNDYTDNASDANEGRVKEILAKLKAKNDPELNDYISDIEALFEVGNKIKEILANSDKVSENDIDNLEQLLKNVSDNSPLKRKLKEIMAKQILNLNNDAAIKSALTEATKDLSNIDPSVIEELNKLYEKSKNEGMNPEKLAQYKLRIDFINNVDKLNKELQSDSNDYSSSTIEQEQSRNNDAIQKLAKMAAIIEQLKADYSSMSELSSNSEWDPNLKIALNAKLNNLIRLSTISNNIHKFNKNTFDGIMNNDIDSINKAFNITSLKELQGSENALLSLKPDILKIMKYFSEFNKSILNKNNQQDLQKLAKLVDNLSDDPEVDEIIKNAIKHKYKLAKNDLSESIKRKQIWKNLAWAGLTLGGSLIVAGISMMIRNKNRKRK